MHPRSKFWVIVAIGGFTVGAAVSWSGCGSSDNPRVIYQGNVQTVIGPTVKAPSAPRSFASLREMLFPEAIAQGSCNAADVLVCAQSTPSGGSTITRCARVNGNTCEFATDLRLADNGDTVSIFFFDDANGNGAKDEGEAQASLSNSLPSSCNGDTIEISNVTIDFDAGTALAESVGKSVNACAATPTPTPTGAATSTPTATGVPSTPTPTSTATP